MPECIFSLVLLLYQPLGHQCDAVSAEEVINFRLVVVLLVPQITNDIPMVDILINHLPL
jgi:hypothetical protein